MTIFVPTQDRQAILLLCAKLGQRDESAPPLNARQYAALANWLHEHSLLPGNLLESDGRAQLADLQLKGLDRERVERLLDRGAVLGIILERWSRSGIWIVTLEDEQYPARYKTYLRHAAPPILYGVGEPFSLQKGGLAIVGSRNASGEDLQFAQRLGSSCAEQKISVISGAAKGIDSESMMAAISQGGCAIGVLAEGLGRAAVAAPYHEAILEGRLTLISPYEPESRWFAFTAMERNKLIYALADAAVVVASSNEQGGTWAGAVEALKQEQIPIYVNAVGEVSIGNRRLLEAGGQQFPSDVLPSLAQLFHNSPRSSLLFDESHRPARIENAEAASDAPSEISTDNRPDLNSAKSEPQLADSSPYNVFLATLLDLTAEPVDRNSIANSIAKKLNVSEKQAKTWLKRAVKEEKIQKTKKPIRYVQSSLFDQ